MSADDLLPEENERLLSVLTSRFPWLGTDQPVEGADVVADLSDLYDDLGGKPRDREEDDETDE
jgi:hypothetical protein